MTPQEKAHNLFESFLYEMPSGLNERNHIARQCALIAVEEIIKSLDVFGYTNTMYDDYETGQVTYTEQREPELFWQQVKQELEKLK